MQIFHHIQHEARGRSACTLGFLSSSSMRRLARVVEAPCKRRCSAFQISIPNTVYLVDQLLPHSHVAPPERRKGVAWILITWQKVWKTSYERVTDTEQAPVNAS